VRISQSSIMMTRRRDTNLKTRQETDLTQKTTREVISLWMILLNWSLHLSFIVRHRTDIIGFAATWKSRAGFKYLFPLLWLECELTWFGFTSSCCRMLNYIHQKQDVWEHYDGSNCARATTGISIMQGFGAAAEGPGCSAELELEGARRHRGRPNSHPICISE